MKVEIDDTQQTRKCRLCRDETVNHIINEVTNQQKKYKTMHDWVGKVLHCELCKRLKCYYTIKWYIIKQKYALENEMHKILWVLRYKLNGAAVDHVEHFIKDTQTRRKKSKQTNKQIDK